ncbi:MAG: hypothetical protein AABW87_00850 [Nanoarchaeota archaeon]
MDKMCDICKRNYGSHKCDKCGKFVCEFDFNVLAKACIACVPRASSLKRTYPLPQGN